jgi:hypothetical protein
MKNQKERNDTLGIEYLARLMLDGFERLTSKEEMRDMREEVDQRFGKAKNILYRGHENRFEKLEDKIS